MGFSYHLSVPIDDRKVLAKLKVEAQKHNAKAKLAPCVLEILTTYLNGEFVRIAPSTPTRSRRKRRVE